MVGPSALHVADSKEKALVVQSWDQLFGEESQQDGADRGEVEVMDHKGSIELERRAVAHQLAAAENYNVVCEDQRSGLLHGRHGVTWGWKSKSCGWYPLIAVKALSKMGQRWTPKGRSIVGRWMAARTWSIGEADIFKK